MYQYASKKKAASTKMTSSGMGKKSASSKRKVFNSSADQHNRQAFNTIQRSHIETEIPSGTRNQYSAGSARRSINKLSPDCSDDMGFIEYVLEKNWSEIISSNQEITSRAEIILKKWNQFLPEFLEYHGFISHGANQSHTYHRRESKNAEEALDLRYKKRLSKIEEIYSRSSNIRKSRKYKANEEIKRYLRHCAAAFAINFGIEDEIQCYYDDDDKVVYVATNNDANSGISGINGINISECSAILQHPLGEINEYMASNDNSPVWNRFKAKLIDMFLSNKKAEPLLGRLRHALMCPTPLRDATFQVIGNTYGIQGLHAERKILYYLRAQKREQDMFLDPLRLGGIRRPCFICSALCFADMSQIRPGPVWVSYAASAPRDISEMFLILDAIRNGNYITYVSESDGNLTTGNDTESEGSESECDIH